MSESSDHQVAFVLQNLTVKDGADKDDFEKFMLEKLFPSVDTSGDGEEPDQHFLLGGSSNEYLWMSRLEYSVHQTPFPDLADGPGAADTGERTGKTGAVCHPHVVRDVFRRGALAAGPREVVPSRTSRHGRGGWPRSSQSARQPDPENLTTLAGSTGRMLNSRCQLRVSPPCGFFFSRMANDDAAARPFSSCPSAEITHSG